jgi:hypothetical protein
MDPEHAGMKYQFPEQLRVHNDEGPIPLSELPPGWYAVSVNFVRGFSYHTYRGNGSKGRLQQNALVELQELTPVATAGYSIYIYHIEDPNE